MSDQLSLYPIRAKRVWSPSSTTRSSPRFALCEDGLDYCIKRDENGYPARANEWIGTWLARASGIAVAKPAIIQDLDGKLVFGSEIYGDDSNDNLGIFQSKKLPGEHLSHIWKTYAFDLFIGNDDRHVNQYKIFYQNRASRILSFDFESSLFKFWPNIPFPLDHHSRTVETIMAIQGIYGKIDIGVTDEVLTRLENVEGAAMVGEIKRLPSGWIDHKRATSFTKWFGSRPRRDRIAQIREGLRNGACL